MDIVEIAAKRYTAKAYDSSRLISENDIRKLLQVLRLTPSSINSQPWHFVVASTQEGKDRVAKSTSGLFAFNYPNVVNASHVIVLCRLIEYQDKDLQKVFDQQYEDKRFPSLEDKEATFKIHKSFVDYHRQLGDVSVARHMKWNCSPFEMEPKSVDKLGVLNPLETDTPNVDNFTVKLLDYY